MEVRIRDAAANDAAAIADIYNPYIVDSSVTFETEPIDAEERKAWLAEHDERHPVLVAVGDEGEVLGWGALSPWASRCAWHRTVEVSVYVHQGCVGRGVGMSLMEALLKRAEQAGHHVVISQIVAGNDPSIRLAEEAGFEHVGVLREVGEKFGQWHDIVLMQKILP